MSVYQLIVLGAGPGGYVTAIRAAQLGRKVAIVEKDKIGGTCLNRGCIPTKALLHSANTYAGRNQFETLGLSYADIRYDMGKIHARKAQVVETLISGVSGLLKANKIDVLSGAAQITAPGKVVVDGKEYTCEDIVIATGSYPARPPIPGLDLPGVVTSNEVLEGEPVDYKSLIIIGGGVIGVELASFYAALGCKVTIVEALDRLLSTLDKEFGQSIAMLLKKRGVQVFCSSMVSSIEQTPDGLVCNLTRKEQQEQVTAEGILVSNGRRPNTEGLFAEGCKPEMNRGFITVDKNYQSTIPHIYAIGDVIGGVQLAHKAEAEGQAVAAIICGDEPHCDPSLVPSCIYTEPEIASVGITADEAKAKGIAVKTGKYLMSGNGKSIIDLQERGFIKVVADAETDRLLGIQMMCGRATDLISEFTMAIANGMTRAQLLKGMRPHPTYCEGITEALEAVDGMSIHSAPARKG